MKKTLRKSQKKAVRAILQFQKSNMDRATMCISVGHGKTSIIVESIVQLLFEKNIDRIMLLSSRRVMCEQFEEELNETASMAIATSIREFHNQQVIVTTYQDIANHKGGFDYQICDLVICDDAQFLNKRKLHFFEYQGPIKILGMFSEPIGYNNPFCGVECIFSYTFKEALQDGYLKEYDKSKNLRDFFCSLLKYLNYQQIQLDSVLLNSDELTIRPDILAIKDNSDVVFEIKYYRSMYIASNIIENAIEQVGRWKSILDYQSTGKKKRFVIIVLCKLDMYYKQKIADKSGIIIWDIENLLYLCDSNEQLVNELVALLPYPVDNLVAETPLYLSDSHFPTLFDQYNKSITVVEEYYEKLKNCKAGNYHSVDKKYEKICTDIVKYLFGTDFMKMSEQHKTDDNMFRMDLLCSLKGSKEFWKFLMEFYKTKFIVFEYKNYSDYLSQNLIYITEKYLFSAALRNVAIIITRHGFNSNAKKAALGCLKEHGKLILSVNDEDLLIMISMKENGEEPSDYLLMRVEEMLMSVSK